MEIMIEKLLTSGSPLVVLVVVVYIFLRFLTNESKKTTEVFTQMHKDHIQARVETRDAMIENTKATLEASRVTEELVQTIRNYAIRT